VSLELVAFLTFVALVMAGAWAEGKRPWARRRPTITLSPPYEPAGIDSARLVQSLRARGYRGAHPAARKQP